MISWYGVPFFVKLFCQTQLIKLPFRGLMSLFAYACQAVKPDMEAVACASFEDMLNEVEEGRAELAMVPVEKGCW